MQSTAIENPGQTSLDGSTPSTVAFCFEIEGDLRFLSHHDELRMLARALRRAGWPLACSQGFNPRPRLVLPLPRRVGTASACQWAVVQLSETPPLEQLQDRLAASLPAACHLQGVVALPPRASPHPRRVAFELELERQHAAQAAPRIKELLAAESLIVERTYGPDKPARAIDIRPYLETITLDGRTLAMRLTFVKQRSARPTEVLTVLDLPASAYNHRVRQVAVEWDMALADPPRRPASAERNNVGQERSGYTQTKEHQA
jgi:radical SAM-linked protein